MNVPRNLKYTKDHEWAKIDGGIATVGITDFAQQQLTDIVFVELPKIGAKAERLKSIAVVESVKSVSDVFAPLSGEVIEVNETLPSSPELVNKEPYGKGWIAKIRLSNPAEAEKLMNAEEYEKYLAGLKH
ncbi:MAG: glycine cleavage system protein GcvH [Candidatus Diapherotrites archaeon]